MTFFFFFLVVSNALILDEIFSPSKRVSPLCFVYSSDEPLTGLLLFIIIVCFKVVFVSFKSYSIVASTLLLLIQCFTSVESLYQFGLSFYRLHRSV